ncbi:hypothetical protein GCM10010259_08150 [Streptomyces daghestanicus]|uniref:Uncharacterized protein n=1 Tax=Streptomyces daghestanicus TaxID=66885 RepID=A0ABQ3Q8U3_9ACTN|nr:hypothetical protein GCM10010240_12090 [Streptomyces griseoviridis]GGU20005.1 hypothetical protein GCM10010259_08150 [Streptomyces daghestanicus]GHI32187.1 hypothetical protein Sdagh_39170 [Streptomyces daghestanicus]GHI33677.1 hypothetical protein Sdagh_54070 [Streptomyces daghestanicus]
MAVMPTYSPGGAPGSSGSRDGSWAVTRTTPEASRDMAARNSSLLTPSACTAVAEGEDGVAGLVSDTPSR